MASDERWGEIERLDEDLWNLICHFADSYIAYIAYLT
jgi:hypothetical protein